MSSYYDWFLALHIISVICWMAGLLYLPRLYAYHTRVILGSEADHIFQEMERKLLRIIINPSMICAIIFGLIISYIYGFSALGIWFHIKSTCVILLLCFHGVLAKYRKAFALGQNKHTERFYRIINELPALFMVIIVIMVVVKPFE